MRGSQSFFAVVCVLTQPQYSVHARVKPDGWMISAASARLEHTCQDLSTPERVVGKRKRDVNQRVVMATLEQSGQKYNPVPNAHNAPALQKTVAQATGLNIKRGVATRMLASLENESDLQQVLEFAQLPELFDDLRVQDPFVRLVWN